MRPQGRAATDSLYFDYPHFDAPPRRAGPSERRGVVIVGAGNLGQALVAYRGFASRGFSVRGIFDSHPDLVGQRLSAGDGATQVRPMSDLESVVARGVASAWRTPLAAAG